MLFRGATKVTVDDKGRVVMPTRYRAQIAERCAGRLIVTADPDQCLRIYPLPDWEPIEQQLLALPSFDPEVRRKQRLMVGYATEVELDGHGRVALTPELREYAHLSRAAMLIGQGKGFELWDEARWMEQRESWIESERNKAGLAAQLASISL